MSDGLVAICGVCKKPLSRSSTPDAGGYCGWQRCPDHPEEEWVHWEGIWRNQKRSGTLPVPEKSKV